MKLAIGAFPKLTHVEFFHALQKVAEDADDVQCQETISLASESGQGLSFSTGRVYERTT